MRRLLPRALATVAVALIPALAEAQRCADDAVGFPVSATSEQVGDAAWLTAASRAAAYRWQVPSGRRNAYAGWERVERRVLPPEPRWADDWSPGDRHRARVRLTLYAGSARPRIELLEESGDGRFDGSLATIVERPMPAAPPFPPVPDGADSVVVTMAFGHEPSPDAGVVRFAASQTRIELVRSSLRVLPPGGSSGRFPATTVKYDVRADGRVDPASFEFVRSGGQEYEEAIRRGLLAARFEPPTSNCRPVAQTVVQTFGR